MTIKLRNSLNAWRDPHSFNPNQDITPTGRIQAAFAVALAPDIPLAIEAYQLACALVAEALPRDRTIEDLMKDPKYRKTIEVISICLSNRRRASMLIRKTLPE